MNLIERLRELPTSNNKLRDEAVKEIESQATEIERLRGVLNEPTLADKLKRLGYKPHGKDIYIPALKETQ